MFADKSLTAETGLFAPYAEKGMSRHKIKIFNMFNLSQFKVSSTELDCLKGGITREEFKKVCQYLYDNEHYDQLVAVMKMYNSGRLQFED